MIVSGHTPPYARPACGLPPPINSHDIGKRRATADEDGHNRFAVSFEPTGREFDR
jgi:hypothetical protein